MKIVMIAPFGMYPKGTVKVRMLPVARELVRLGHAVSIVIPPWTNPEDSGRKEVIDGVNIENIKLPKGVGPLAKFLIAGRLIQTALELRPDVIHCFKPKGYSGLAAMFLRAKQKMGGQFKLVIDTDDWEGRGGWNDFLDYSWLQKKLFQFQESWVPRHVDGVTVASRTLQAQAWGFGVRPERVLYLPNGIVQAKLADGGQIRERYGIGNRPVLLLYTRFFEFPLEKVVKVFSGVQKTIPDIIFLVAGKGKFGEEERLKDRAKELGFSESLIVTGWLDPDDIPSHIAAADVAVYPFSDTLINRAKCPVKLTELLMQGKAVVADRVGQVAEYIKPEVSGILCEPDDWNEMENKTVWLLQNREERQQLGESGRSFLLERFSWKSIACRLEIFYKNQLSK